MKNLTFSDKDVVITGKDANVLAGFALVGIAATTVAFWKVCYVTGELLGGVIYNLRHKSSK